MIKILMTKIALKNVALCSLYTFMNSEFSSNIGIILLKGIATLPFWFIYFISDILYVFIYYVIAYRKKVVLQNLRNAFPEKNEKEIKIIAKKFFHHFCDLTLETIKMSGMKKRDYEKRITIKNNDLINSYFDEGRNVIVLTMHFNNWEWSNCFPLHIKHKILGVFKPLHNLQFNTYLNETRGKMGSELVADSKILRRIAEAQKKSEMIFIWLAADQTPPASSKFWTIFMNQETPFFSGPEKIAARTNYPVFFHYNRKIKRGHYEINLVPLFNNPQKIESKEILLEYIRKMEATINENPEYYLWSHKRWKHKRPKGISLQ
jgi:Kdo2-lipid IVA lauroyltransferase/acyltransferase